MQNIKEIAIRIGMELFDESPYDSGHVVDSGNKCSCWLIDFAEALVAELTKGNEPAEYHCSDFDLAKMILSDCGCSTINNENLTSRVADRIAKHRRALEPTASQIEQETAEKCAEWVRSGLHDDDPYIIARGLEDGAWKEFKCSK